jgi:Ca2+-binding RTX toxin-like protein
MAAAVQWQTSVGGNGHYYEVVYTPTGIPWDEARGAAIAKGGYLATITSSAENALVFGLADDPLYWYQDGYNNSEGPWLGGYQPAGSSEPNGDWRWVSGEAFNFTNWASGEPNDFNLGEDALLFMGRSSFGIPGRPAPTWNDGAINAGEKAYIIEYNNWPGPGATDGPDNLTGTPNADLISGLGGNDKLNGLAGSDTLNGGMGADSMTGGTGNDTYFVDSAGDKVIEAPGGGTDSVSSTITYTLATNVENLTLTGTSGINGTGNGLNNVMTGNSAANALSGLDGNDSLNGLGGNDALTGGNGNDTLNGGTGIDSMTGGAGNDLYYVDNAGDRVIEAAGGGTDTVSSSTTHTLATNVENLTLSGGAVVSGTGNTVANVLTGNAAANSLYGLGGNDTLNGLGGNDSLDGGSGNDMLVGGAGVDVLIGGTGADRFDFNLVTESTSSARDTIKGFDGAGVAVGDLIDLSGIDANTTLAGNQLFGFGGTSIGRLSLVNSGSTTLVRGNVDADADFEFVFAIEDGTTTLASAYKAADFIL